MGLSKIIRAQERIPTSQNGSLTTKATWIGHTHPKSPQKCHVPSTSTGDGFEILRWLSGTWIDSSGSWDVASWGFWSVQKTTKENGCTDRYWLSLVGTCQMSSHMSPSLHFCVAIKSALAGERGGYDFPLKLINSRIRLVFLEEKLRWLFQWEPGWDFQ